MQTVCGEQLAVGMLGQRISHIHFCLLVNQFFPCHSVIVQGSHNSSYFGSNPDATCFCCCCSPRCLLACPSAPVSLTLPLDISPRFPEHCTLLVDRCNKIQLLTQIWAPVGSRGSQSPMRLLLKVPVTFLLWYPQHVTLLWDFWEEVCLSPKPGSQCPCLHDCLSW